MSSLPKKRAMPRVSETRPAFEAPSGKKSGVSPRNAGRLGLSVVWPIGDRDYGLRDFVIADPDGYGVRFASRLKESP